MFCTAFLFIVLLKGFSEKTWHVPSSVKHTDKKICFTSILPALLTAGYFIGHAGIHHSASALLGTMHETGNNRRHSARVLLLCPI